MFPGRPQEHTGAARRRPALDSGLVGDYREQPRSETGAGPEASERAVRFHEGLLGRVLGLRGVARDEVGGAEGHLLVAAHQPLISRSVSTLRPLCELRVIRGDGPPPRRRSLPLSTTPGAKRFPGVTANDDASAESLRVPQGKERFFAYGAIVVCAPENRHFLAC